MASKLFEHSKNQIITEKNRPQHRLRSLSKTHQKLNIILFSTLFCPFRRPWPQFGLNFYPYQKSSKSLIQQRFSSFSRAEKEGFEPSRRFTRPTPLAGAPLRPLEYFSEFIFPMNFSPCGVRIFIHYTDRFCQLFFSLLCVCQKTVARTHGCRRLPRVFFSLFRRFFTVFGLCRRL